MTLLPFPKSAHLESALFSQAMLHASCAAVSVSTDYKWKIWYVCTYIGPVGDDFSCYALNKGTKDVSVCVLWEEKGAADLYL